MADQSPLRLVSSSTQADAFHRLADEHLDAAYQLARAIMRDPAEAQDATHDAFVQAWRKWSTLRDPERFPQWFDRILVNTCRNRLSHARRWHATDISTELNLATRDQYGPSDDRAALEGAIGTLSPDHRVVVALRYYRDLSVEEIARRLDIPAGTVQSRLHYALKHMQDALQASEQKGVSR